MTYNVNQLASPPMCPPTHKYHQRSITAEEIDQKIQMYDFSLFNSSFQMFFFLFVDQETQI